MFILGARRSHGDAENCRRTAGELPENCRGTAWGRSVLELDEVTGQIVDAALRIHRDLGPGLLESVYEATLARALERRGLHVRRQHAFSLTYDGLHFDEAFRVDLLVEDQVIVELKSVEKVAPVHGKQLLTYLKLTDRRVGLLINFGAGTLKEGLHRILNAAAPRSCPQFSGSSPRLRVTASRPGTAS
jgi:iron complex transport system substrate-binding protein